MLQSSLVQRSGPDSSQLSPEGESATDLNIPRRDMLRMLFGGTVAHFSGVLSAEASSGIDDKHLLNTKLEEIRKESINLLAYHRIGGLLLDQGPYLDRQVCNIAAEGFACCGLIIGVETGQLSRREAASIIDEMLHAIESSPQIRFKGWISHLIDLGNPGELKPYITQNGERNSVSEFSSIDTALFMMGALIAAHYFGEDYKIASRVRALLSELDFKGLMPTAENVSRGAVLSHGFSFNGEQIPHFWDTCSEGVLVSFLSQAQATSSVNKDVWYQWDRRLFQLPLFTSYYPLAFLNLKGFTDASGVDLWERAEIRMQEHYDECSPYLPHNLYGVTACYALDPQVCDLPKRTYKVLDRVTSRLDATIAPHAVVASLPFLKDKAIAAMKVLDEYGALNKGAGPINSIDLTSGLIDDWVTTIDVGSALLMLDAAETKIIHRLSDLVPEFGLAKMRCRIRPRSERLAEANSDNPLASSK